MIVNLDEAKLYLRIDGDEEDTLITSLFIQQRKSVKIY